MGYLLLLFNFKKIIAVRKSVQTDIIDKLNALAFHWYNFDNFTLVLRPFPDENIAHYKVNWINSSA